MVHDIEVVDTTAMKFSDVRKSTQRADGSKKVTDIVRAPTVDFIESDHETFNQMVELLGNEYFSPILVQDDYSIRLYGDPVNFRHTLSGKDGNVRRFSITVQNDYWKLMMDWNVKEILTHWDYIGSSAFIYGGSANEGYELSDTTLTWLCVNGDWTQHASEYLYADSVVRNVSIATVVEVDGNDFYPLADVDVQVDVLGYLTDYPIGLIIRCTNEVGTAYGSAYFFYINLYDDTINFSRLDGTTETLLRQWSPFDDPLNHTDGTSWDYEIWYTMRIVANGNRFDCYFEDVDTNLVYIGTVYDDIYESGWHGVGTDSASFRFDNFTISHSRSIALDLPVGSYDIDKITMKESDRLNDNTNADGSIETVISPSEPIEFKQTVAELGDPSGGEVKVFDSMNSATESDWRRVYSIDHKFVGDIIISNGLIRLKYEKVTTQIITGVYANTSWEEITFLPDWSTLTLEHVDSKISELTRYSATLREACIFESTTGFDMVWTDYTIRSGSPMINIENRRAL